MIRSLSVVGMIGLAVVGGAGCTVNAAADPPPPVVVSSDGSLTVDWTVNDAKDASECAHYGADSAEIVVTASDGSSAGTFDQACTAFATSVSLEPGTYSATAYLLDAAGHQVTTAVDIGSFHIRSGTDLDEPIDFPDSSFL